MSVKCPIFGSSMGEYPTLLIFAREDAPAVQNACVNHLRKLNLHIIPPTLAPSPQELAAADALLLAGYGPSAPSRNQVQEAWPFMSKLKWCHTTYTGKKQLSFPEAMHSSVIITNSKGVYSDSLAEFALAACSYFAKDLPRLQRAKADKKWDPFEVEELRGKTFGVVGYGSIGQACAKLARALKMHVVGFRRRAELSQQDKEEGLLDAIYTPGQLNNLMSVSDYVVLSTPYTPQTDKLVDSAALAAMKPNAVFVNVGRGRCVDEQALIQALKSHRIRGAALDVFTTEPLPKESEIWDMDNVLISPHCADRVKDFQEWALEAFAANMQRWLSCLPLLNEVDKQAGY